MITPPKFNIASENQWLEVYFPFGARPIFRGELLNLQGVILLVSVFFGCSDVVPCFGIFKFEGIVGSDVQPARIPRMKVNRCS